MYELVQVGKSTWYIECPAKMGLWVRPAREGGAAGGMPEAWLIDSGNDKEAGKKALKIIEGQGWSLAGVVNTHANADHIGGNKLLQDRTGCAVFASGIDAAITRYPELEPAFLYGGFPPQPLRNKFLQAQPSRPMDLAEEEAGFPNELERIPLPGHFFHMFGVRTPDDVVFLADCLSSETILEKYHLVFIYDVAAYLETLKKVEAMEAACFVPSHAAATADIRPLAALNRQKVAEAAALLVGLCRSPRCFEDILQGVFRALRLEMDFNQYALIGSTVRSYLSWLLDQGRIKAEFVDAKLLWSAAEE